MSVLLGFSSIWKPNKVSSSVNIILASQGVRVWEGQYTYSDRSIRVLSPWPPSEEWNTLCAGWLRMAITYEFLSGPRGKVMYITKSCHEWCNRYALQHSPTGNIHMFGKPFQRTDIYHLNLPPNVSEKSNSLNSNVCASSKTVTLQWAICLHGNNSFIHGSKP